jgi:hypothetical protein
MTLHLLKMTPGVDDMIGEMLTAWPNGIGRDPNKVQDGDIVFLLGHGGGESTVRFAERWKDLVKIFHPKNKAFVLLMCGQGHDGGSAQVAELIAKEGAQCVVYCDNLLMLVYVMEMPAGLGIGTWADLFRKEDGETWPIPQTKFFWTCLSNANGQSLALSKG